MRAKLLAMSLMAIAACGFISCSGDDHSGSSFMEEHNQKWQTIASTVVRGAKTDREKAQIIYNYICENIAYDTSYKVVHADECWETKKGVCQAYCELFYYIADAVGLKAEIVAGISKNNGRLGDHAWIAAYYDGGYHLMDPTWGAGTVDNSVFHKSPDHSPWYEVNPYALIFSHLPSVSTWSMIDTKVSNEQFRRLPDLPSGLLKTGFDYQHLLQGLLDGSITDVPAFYSHSEASIQLIDIPLTGTLKVGQPYVFRIKPGNGQEWFLTVDGKAQQAWTEEIDGTLSMVVTPREANSQVTLNMMVGTSQYAVYIVYRTAS